MRKSHGNHFNDFQLIEDHTNQVFFGFGPLPQGAEGACMQNQFPQQG